MRLYIIRHGQSINNALANPRNRVCDPTLTDLGRRQAELVAKHLATGTDPEYFEGVSEEDTTTDSRQGYRLTRLYCSAMHRALLTARPISQAVGLKAEVWLDIHEHGGIYLDHDGQGGVIGYPGKTRNEIMDEFPDYILPGEVTELGWWDPRRGMEDWPACYSRAIKVANMLREWAATPERIAIVSHGGFIDALLKALTRQLPSLHLFFHHYNTAITRIDFRADGTLDFRYINRFDHLPSELIS
jgi:broad specificity phosphatase PhoE